MGERKEAKKAEIKALQQGMDLGMTLIDTAEMYASGGAEEVVAEAIKGRRDQAFVVTKVLPQNADRQGTITAAESSLRRLGIDCVDLYLLHWRGAHPLSDTVTAFEDLRSQGKIRAWGVSNFDVADLAETASIEAGGQNRSNQILYNLSRRNPEHQVLPWCRDHNVMVMAYSPVEQGSLKESRGLRQVAEKHHVSAYAVAVAWSARLPGVISIPKAVNPKHVLENARAGDLILDEDDLALLDGDFPRSKVDAPLEPL